MCKKLFILLGTAMFALGMSVLSYAMMCGDGSDSNKHGSHQQLAQASNEHMHEMEPVAENKTVEVAINVGNKICPVSGEKVSQEGMKSATYEYKGKIYNFCCAACIEDFKKDPQKYIKKVEQELQGKPKEE